MIKPKNPKILCISLIFISILVIIISGFFIKPILEKIPADFYYEADIFSVSNFYSPEIGNFSEPQILKVKFYYEIVSKKEDIFIIRGVFDVKTISEDKILYIERLYGINAKTAQHVIGYETINREGHLFAPKKLKKNQTFIYWHISYDGPIKMEFQGEEEIYGLKVYRYKSNFNADQTQKLSHLPLVNEKIGVEQEVAMQIWIEPITGMMIKYNENTTAYYYELETRKRIYPWGKFSYKYQENSVQKQVNIAKLQKSKILWAGKIIPAIFGLFIVVLLIFLFKQEKLTSETNKTKFGQSDSFNSRISKFNFQGAQKIQDKFRSVFRVSGKRKIEKKAAKAAKDMDNIRNSMTFSGGKSGMKIIK